MSGQRFPAKAQLRRSLSEQLRDSTAKAWDLLWRNVRERRLAGQSRRGAGEHLPRGAGARGLERRGRRGGAGAAVPAAPGRVPAIAVLPRARCGHRLSSTETRGLAASPGIGLTCRRRRFYEAVAGSGAFLGGFACGEDRKSQRKMDSFVSGAAVASGAPRCSRGSRPRVRAAGRRRAVLRDVWSRLRHRSVAAHTLGECKHRAGLSL